MTRWNGKQAVRGLSVVVLAALLGACASTSGNRNTPDYAVLMGQAESSVRAGQVDNALIAFRDAATADPTQKEPWVRTAQLEFDRTHYARAIVAAEEAMQRDPDDIVADGILTVSGFRIANHALQRLQGRGALASETARREAETLANTLRETMGPAILAEPEPARASRRNARTPQRSQPATSAPAQEERAPAAPAPAARGADPFKNIGGN
ncbi:tetratricopeptide repeat protein [Luteimonas yindakuii]|nr:hypothetical protein [Luteimonas yindakuii]